jgi:hypothetical protein
MYVITEGYQSVSYPVSPNSNFSSHILFPILSLIPHPKHTASVSSTVMSLEHVIGMGCESVNFSHLRQF